MQRVALGEVDIADGIIHLVKEVLVVIRTSHALQLADLTLKVSSWHYLGLGNASVEFQFIGRVQTYHVLERLVGLVLLSKLCLYLSHQEPFAGLLLAALLVLDDLAQIG